MTSQIYGIIIGGILPALFFGLSGVFAKPATQIGIGTGLYILIVGLGASMAGLIIFLLVPDKTWSFRSGFYASLVGICWAIAAGLVAFALTKYNVPIAKLVPLYNMNTLVAVLIGLFIFAESKDLNTTKLIFGSVLIVVGGSLVATS